MSADLSELSDSPAENPQQIALASCWGSVPLAVVISFLSHLGLINTGLLWIFLDSAELLRLLSAFADCGLGKMAYCRSLGLSFSCKSQRSGGEAVPVGVAGAAKDLGQPARQHTERALGSLWSPIGARGKDYASCGLGDKQL